MNNNKKMENIKMTALESSKWETLGRHSITYAVYAEENISVSEIVRTSLSDLPKYDLDVVVEDFCRRIKRESNGTVDAFIKVMSDIIIEVRDVHHGNRSVYSIISKRAKTKIMEHLESERSQDFIGMDSSFTFDFENVRRMLGCAHIPEATALVAGAKFGLGGV